MKRIRKTYDTDLLRYLLRSTSPSERAYVATTLRHVTQQIVDPESPLAIYEATCDCGWWAMSDHDREYVKQAFDRHKADGCYHD